MMNVGSGAAGICLIYTHSIRTSNPVKTSIPIAEYLAIPRKTFFGSVGEMALILY